MPGCPNCGRRTMRTKDWVCQWCGYPLISRAYKVIDKTYRELQEERSLASKYGELEEESEQEPELEQESEPEPRQRPQPKPVQRSRPAPEPEPEPERKPVSPPRPVLRPRPEPEMKPEPEPRSAPQPRPVLRPEPEPESKPIPSRPVLRPSPEPRPEPEPAPEPLPLPTIKLETIRDGMEISADQLDALYRVEKAQAHAKFTGKTIIVRGTVDKVFVREHLEIRYIVLTGAGRKGLWSIRCTFDKESSSPLNRLKEGEEVLVRGKYDGYSKNIILKECQLV